jgi:uncharacterized protein YebE (UPF0316 family)
MEAIFSSTNVLLIALGIFILRVLNMTLDTLRMMVVMRGMKTLTFILGFFQTAVFVLALGSVISDLNNPLNTISYSLGFATGNVVGMMIEKRLALGFINITIMSPAKGPQIAETLRGKGHAVTEIPARGKDGAVEVLECSVQRKFAKEVQDMALDADPDAFITSRDIQRIWRGYWRD